MFTEYEIETIIDNKSLIESIQALKKDFIKTEAPYLEINDHDFFSLVMMAPIVGVALANGSVSLFEELALNKKARKLSKGGYFMKKDPVVYAMKFLIKKYDAWEDKFCHVLKQAMNQTFDKQSLMADSDPNAEVDEKSYKMAVFNTPYILIRFISSFFLEQDEDIINKRSIGKSEYGRLVHIGKKLDLDKMPIFQMFCKTYTIK